MTKMVIKTVDEINHSRKRTRIIFTLVLVPFLLVALAMGYKVANMYATTQQAIEKFNLAQATPADAEKLFNETLELLTPMETEVFAERWIVHYNHGTALIATNSNDEGVEKLKQALTEIDPNKPEICYIYANLAIGYEKLGDESKALGNIDEANYWYDQALLVVETATMCQPPTTNSDSDDQENPDSNNEEGDNESSSDSEEGETSPDSEGGESLEGTKGRVSEKQNEMNGTDGEGDQQEQDGDTGGQSDKPGQSEIDQIKEQMDKAAEDKSGKDAAGNQEGDGMGGSPEPWNKPW